ncbi:MAG: TonB family protein [Pseudomonadota bacterium]
MKPGLLSLAACALASPAMAQESAVRRDADGCSVSAPPGTEADAVATAGLGLDGRSWIRASGEGWPFEPGGVYRIRAREVSALDGTIADRPEDEIGLDARGFGDSSGRSGIVMTGAPIALYRSRLALYRGDETQPFATIVNPAAHDVAGLRACLTALAATDRGSGKPAATPARPRGGMGWLVSNDDYPAAALRAGQSGNTGIRITVSAHGIPSGCVVTQSSGSALLDTTSCTLIMRRGRFNPGLDAAGQRTEGSIQTLFRWVLPQDDPPPPAPR